MDLMYPKRPTKKRRRKHPKSIIRQQAGTCFLCVAFHDDYRFHRALHKHHVFDGPNKATSEENGFTVDLCWRHHTYGPESVHNDIESMRYIQKAVQQEYEKTHSREEFMALIGRSYL